MVTVVYDATLDIYQVGRDPECFEKFTIKRMEVE